MSADGAQMLLSPIVTGCVDVLVKSVQGCNTTWQHVKEQGPCDTKRPTGEKERRTTVSADWRLRPRPAARMDSRKMKALLSGALNCCIAVSLRTRWLHAAVPSGLPRKLSASGKPNRALAQQRRGHRQPAKTTGSCMSCPRTSTKHHARRLQGDMLNIKGRAFGPHRSSREVEPSMRSARMVSPLGSTLAARYACTHEVIILKTLL